VVPGLFGFQSSTWYCGLKVRITEIRNNAKFAPEQAAPKGANRIAGNPAATVVNGANFAFR